jgi:poly [ADP-ribose] polymerase
MWRVERHDDKGRIPSVQEEVLGEKPKIGERPLHQPDKRLDLSPGALKRFSASNTSLLFHGTRSVNVSGILRESLRLPKTLVGVVITGAMFGPGLYFADDWKKSAGYTSLQNSYWSGGAGSVKGRSAFMFAVDVVLGNPFVAPGAKGYTSPPDGHHSIFGKAGASGVQNNEFIVFKRDQHQLRYLVEFTTT